MTPSLCISICISISETLPQNCLILFCSSHDFITLSRWATMRKTKNKLSLLRVQLVPTPLFSLFELTAQESQPPFQTSLLPHLECTHRFFYLDALSATFWSLESIHPPHPSYTAHQQRHLSSHTRPCHIPPTSPLHHNSQTNPQQSDLWL